MEELLSLTKQAADHSSQTQQGVVGFEGLPNNKPFSGNGSTQVMQAATKIQQEIKPREELNIEQKEVKKEMTMQSL